MTKTPIIQVAGVCDQAEANALIEVGVQWLGFPLRLAVHQPDLSEAATRQLIKTLAIHDESVLITYETDPAAIYALCDYLGIRKVQCHAPMSPDDLARLKALNQELFIIKSLIVGNCPLDELIADMHATAAFVDAYITDTFDAKTGATGATGKLHDWAVSQALVSQARRPVILAGGLDEHNVAAAIKAVRPHGVDAHTGLEDKTGRKDVNKVRKFIDNATAAFAEIGIT